ncbi:MAG TPA: type VI secretion system membrane subunit TssM [Rhodanobacteraceae bacterium]|nr:type VI secretion system membrane subunit TssM [Rhodanobacteraceae bacterium]
MGKVLGFMKSGWFWALVGVILLSLLVWFGGPYLGIGNSQPLYNPIPRLVVIVIIVAIWAIALQVAALRARNKARQLSGEVAAQAPVAGEPDTRSADERAQLQSRFSEAVETLRKRRHGGGNLYTLPWYVVIGPPGSGKSTLVQNSGLHFPLSDQFGKDALRGIGGTRNCDWWFTDEAVFLDTAGRYTTQDSDHATDAGAWAEFLKLLRRYRKRRPINGVMVAMSVSDLLTLDAAGVKAHVAAVRRRLDELGEQLHIGVPVYLVLTKCDLVAGFTEFFDNLDAENRNQVWGVSFPVAQTMDGSAASAFAGEFDLLIDQLNARVLDRLYEERDRNRRAAVLSFPLQMGSLREIVKQFVEGVFSGHQYGTPPLLRGVYLTSGTQEGTPIDRMMGAVARTFGLDPTRVQPSSAKQRTFFVERLLKDVLFHESGFAGTDPKLERSKVLMQIGVYAGVALVTVLLLAALFTSYGRNHAYLGEVQAAVAQYPAKADVTGATDDKTYFAQALQRLDAMASVEAVARKYQGNVPWLMRFGLYQGNAVGDEVHGAYLRELNALLLPGVAMRFRNGLSSSASDPQALYYYLKGYLMLGEPAHRDTNQLVALTNIEWNRIFPSDTVLQQALGKQFAVLVQDPKKLRALPLDKGLVAQARATLQTADLATLVYGNLKLKEAVSNDPPLDLDKAMGLLGNVFRRQSGAPLSQPVPALYTQPVFRREVDKGISDAVDQFAKDDWVFGATRMDTLAKSRMQQQVLALYEQDYIKQWDDLLNDFALQPITDIQAASAVAAKLAGPSSPLKALLKVVADNTSDMLRAPDDGTAGKAKAGLEDLAKQQAAQAATQNALSRVLAGSAAASAPAAKPGDAITAHFDALDKLSEGGPGAAPIDQTLQAIGQLSKTLLTMSDFTDAAGQANPQMLLAQQQVAALPSPVSTWLAALTGKTEALVASGTKSALGKQFQQAVGKNCAAFTQGRFPFAASAKEIPLQNFAALFGYGGAFDAYYTQTLSKLVDASGSSWQWKTGPGAVAGPPGVLYEAQLADEIKQAYFHTGANQPEVDFTIANPQLGDGIGKLVIDIDGQTFTYTPGAPSRMAMKWPGPKPGLATVSAWDTSGNLLSTFSYPGDWAFFRALDAGHLQKQSDLSFVATFNFGGHVAKFSVLAGSLKNPFLNTAVRRFRCGG